MRLAISNLRNYSELGPTLDQNLPCYGYALGVRIRESMGASGCSAVQ
jgi:hypothetical protein